MILFLTFNEKFVSNFTSIFKHQIKTIPEKQSNKAIEELCGNPRGTAVFDAI